MIDGVKVFDIHAHIGLPTTGTWGEVSYTPEKLLERMKKCGIDIAAICPLPSGNITPEQFRSANDYVLESASKYEELIPLCLLNPLLGEFTLEELHRCQAAGAKGVKLYPIGHGNYYIDSPVVDEMMREIEKLGMIVLVHSDFSTECCTPYQIARLAKRYPSVYMILAHFGCCCNRCWFVPEIVEETPNVLLDTACAPPIPEAIFVHPVEVVGAERLVIGNDMPDIHAELLFHMLEIAETEFNLSKEAKRTILGGNMACKVLGII